MYIFRLSTIGLFVFLQSLFFISSAFSQNIHTYYNSDTARFTLDATAVVSSSDSSLQYSWSIITRPSGSSTFITSANEPISNFTADVLGQYAIELRINEGGEAQDPLQFTISTDRSLPVADFNIEGVPTLGEALLFDAQSAYHPDGVTLTYDWSILSAPEGSTSTLSQVGSNAVGFVRGFSPDVEGEYKIRLSVSDWFGSIDTIEKTFSTTSLKPIANAGADRSVPLNQRVYLDPFSSINPSANAESSELEASWTLIYKPAGSAVELEEVVKGRQPFVPDVAGSYVAQLTITGEDGVDRDTVVISVGDEEITNVRPLSSILAQKADGTIITTQPAIVAGELIKLSGVSSSDQDGDLLSYKWSLVSAPQGSTPVFSASNTPQTDFTPDIAGEYIVSLNVDDGEASHTRTLLLSSNRTKPIAMAGKDLVLPANRNINVDGSNSSSNEGSALSYLWSIIGLGTQGAVESGTIDDAGVAATQIAFGSIDPSTGGGTTQTTSYNVITGTNDADTLLGTNGSDRIEGKDGADEIIGRFADDFIEGGADNDLIYGDGKKGASEFSFKEDFTSDYSHHHHHIWKIVWWASQFNGWDAPNGWEIGPASIFGVPDEGHGSVVEMDVFHNATLTREFNELVKGVKYAVSLDVALRRHPHIRIGQEGVAVRWNGELLGEIKPGSLAKWSNHSFEIASGSGDGSDKLSLVGIGPSNAVGALVDNVSITQGGSFSDNLEAVNLSGRTYIANRRSGEINGWTAPQGWEVGLAGLYGVPSEGHNKVFEMDAYRNVTLKRSFDDLSAGEVHTLSLDVALRRNSRVKVGRDGVAIHWNGELIEELKPSKLAQWSTHTFNLIAGSGDGTNTLSLVGLGPSNSYGALVDNISLMQSLSAGDDIIYGGLGDDVIYGGDADDTIFGGDGDDIIYGDFAPLSGLTHFEDDFESVKLYHHKSYYVSYHSSTFNGWTAPQGWEVGLASLYGVPSEGHNKVLEMDAYRNVTLKRKINALVSGETYTLSLDAALRNSPRINVGSDGLRVHWNGALIGEIKPSALAKWSNYNFNLVAGSGDGTDTLSLVGIGPSNSYGALVDNITLIQPLGTGNDILTGGAGNDKIFGGAGNDEANYQLSENIDAVDRYDGGRGIDTLTLRLSADENQQSNIQTDIANYRDFLSQNTDASTGEANSKSFEFTAFDLTASGFEELKILTVVTEVDAAIIQLKVQDIYGMSFDTLLTTNGNIAPIATITAAQNSADIGSSIALQSTGSEDANADPLSYKWSLLSRPENSKSELVIEDGAENASIIPDKRGAYVVQLIASDGALQSEPSTIVVFGNNRAPVITSQAPTDAVANMQYIYQATATDADEDELTWSLVTGPQGATIGTQTGLINFTPTTPGDLTFEVAVVDGFGGRDNQIVTLQVEDPRNLLPPTISAPQTITVRPGELVSFDVVGSDPEGETVSFQALPLPTGASFSTQSGAFFFIVDDEIGVRSVEFFVSDGVLSASTTVKIETVPWPEDNATKLSGRVLDAGDFSNGTETPVVNAAVTIAGVSVVTDANGNFSFADLSISGDNQLTTNGVDAVTSDDSIYGKSNSRITIYEHGENVLNAPILLAKLGDEDVQIIEVTDKLPSQIKSCKIQRVDSKDGSDILLSSLPLQAYDPLSPGSKAVIWSRSGEENYRIISEATIGSDGTTLENATGSIIAGSNLIITPLPVTALESALQAKSRLHTTVLGEGNMQTSFSLPGYSSLGATRAPSFVYNSTAADPRPIITTNVELPADTTLTQNLQVEVFINGQKMPGVGVIDISQAVVDGSSLPTQGTLATTSISVAFNATSIPTGVHAYEVLVFAQHECAAAAAKAEGEVFINNRSESVYGSGWKPAELQELITLPDGSLAVEEPDGTISHFENDETPSIVSDPILFDIIDPERAESGDIDNDGDIDILAVEGKTGDVLIIENLGLNTRQFQLRERFDAGSNGEAAGGPNSFAPDTNDVAIADFNNDGITDFATSHQHDNVGRVFLGQGDKTFVKVEFAIGSTNSVTSGDYNGDGIADVAYALNTYSYIVYGPVSSTSLTAVPNQRGRNINDVDTADMNNDGYDDLVSAAASSDRIEIAFGGPTNDTDRPAIETDSPITISTPDGIRSGGLQQLFSIGDIDGDGILEIAAAGNNNLLVFKQNADGLYENIYNKRLPNGGNPESVAIRDIQGDGFAEIIAVNKTAIVYIFERDAIFGNELPIEITIPGSGDDTINVADYDGDGKQDIVLFYDSGISGTPDNVAIHFGRGVETRGFITPLGDFTNLTRNEDGSFTRLYKNGASVNFNAQGQQLSTTDANGNTTLYAYNENGGVSSMTDPTGLVTSYTYENGLLATITTPDGNVTTLEHDEEGNLISSSQPNITLPQTFTAPDGEIIIVGDGDNATINYPQTSYRTDKVTVGFTYDANGRIIGQIDERGKTTTNVYGAAGRLTKTTLPDGGDVKLNVAKTLGLSEFGVDLDAPTEGKYIEPDDRVTRLEDARGNVAVKRVNEFGATVETYDPIGRTTLYERDKNNLVTRIDSPSSSTSDGRLFTDLAYDDKGNITLKREAAGTDKEREMAYEYEPQFSQITSMTNYEGFKWVHTYDDKGNRLTTTNPDDTVMGYTYNDKGQVLTSTDERGNVVTYQYDEYGRYITMLDAKGIEISRTLDSRGNPNVIVLANGEPEAQASIHLFDDRNRAIASINAEDEATSFSYDNFGNPRATTDATGIVSDNVYDDKSRIAFVDDPASGRTAIDYDLTDNVTKIEHSDGTTTSLVYDDVNRISEATDGIGVKRRYVYDLRDNQIAVTDGRGNTTTFAYDELDRLISRTNPVGNVWRFEYDKRDLRTATIKPDGTRVEFTYDSRSRLVSYGVQGDANTTRNYTYDDEDNLLSASAAGGTDIAIAHAFTYDERDQITQASFAAGALSDAYSIDYEFDALQRRTKMSDSAGGVTSYTYDDADRLTSVQVPSGRIIDLSYDDASRRTNLAMPNGLNEKTIFATPQGAGNDGTTGLLASLSHGLDNNGATGSSLSQLLGTFTYQYNQKANITGITESGTAARTRNYTLDPIERLTNVNDSTGTSVENYTLDEEGNRITSHLASFHVTDAANRVTEDEKHQFESNVNGNLVRKTNKVTGATSRYVYSVYDELIEVTAHSGVDAASPVLSRTRYIYDAFGRRHAQRNFDASDNATGGKNFFHDGLHLAFVQNIEANTTKTVENTRWYSHSNTVDELLTLTLARGDGDASPTATTSDGFAPSDSSYYYHSDHQGSVRALSDESGNVVNEYAYDSYGNPDISVEGVPQVFGYTGRFLDAETGLYYYRARHYDASTARFLQEDPIWFAAGDLNVHRYVWNNPVNWNDPSGLNALAEYGGLASNAVRQIIPLATIGNRVSCIFSIVAGVLNVANVASSHDATIEKLTTYATTAGDVALECGARATFKRLRYSPCKGKKIMGVLRGVAQFGLAAANLNILLKSFDGETLVLTPDGYVAIQNIKVGDEVIAIDEKTGKEVTRKVTERFTRQAPNTFTLEVEDEDGNRNSFITTGEHPFHVEEWKPTTTGELLASLELESRASEVAGEKASDAVSDEPVAIYEMFPSDEGTKFGDWVKAGALQPGDKISIRKGIDAVSGDKIVTVKSITKDNSAKRVYNLEIESLDGENTHNYFIGEDELWVHNGRTNWSSPFGKMVREIWGEKCIYCGNPANTIEHITPKCRGGEDTLSNTAPACKSCNSSKGGKPLKEFLAWPKYLISKGRR